MSADTTARTIAAEIALIMADVVGADGNAITGLGPDGETSVSLSYAVGRRAQVIADTPPRVVWVLGAGTGAAAVKNGFPGGRRSLLTRQPTLRAVCWGKDLDAASDLASAVCAAMVRRYGGRIPFLGEEWADDAAATDYGEGVVLSWRWSIAVLDRAPSRVTVTSATPDTSAATTGDVVLHLGESP